MLLPQKDLSPEDLASRAEIVFRGVCKEKTKESTAHPATKVPVPLNVYSFKVEEAIKGNFKAGDVFKVKQIGVETRREAYRLGVELASGHHFEVGKSYLLFLGGENHWGIRPLVEGVQGQYVVTQEAVLKNPFGIPGTEEKQSSGKVQKSLKEGEKEKKVLLKEAGYREFVEKVKASLRK